MGMWVCPSPEEIRDKINLAGGRVRVAEALQKSTRTIDFWRFGKRKMSLSDWKQISIMANR